MRDLSVVIPVFNEETVIARVAQQILSVLGKGNQDFEIIIVDDGSMDGTFEQANTVAGVRVIQHTGNRGYGSAIATGMRHAVHDLICIIDGDGSYPVEHIPRLVVELVQGKFDMVVGARIGDKVAIPLIRRPAKWFITKLAKLVAEQEIPDLNSGLRIFRRRSVSRFSNLLPKGFSFTTTITLAMYANGYHVQYVPIDYYPRVGRSKIRPIRDTLNFLNLILRIALYFAPLKIFIPFSAALSALALLIGLYTWLVVGEIADVTTIVIAMTALQVAMIGLLAEMINHRVGNSYQNSEEE